MQHYYSLDDVLLKDVWLTIGSFDGVHRGHQAIINELTAGAHREGVPAVVLTFHPHPAVVLRKRKGPHYLTTPEERAVLLGDLGVDVVITHPFTPEVAALPAGDFMRVVKSHLGIKHLCVGHDFALGRRREGDIAVLRQLGEELGYTLNVLPPVYLGDDIASSSRIRAALADGNVERARSLLGRPYQLGGDVIHGDGRGSTLGIPTANLAVWPERIVPKTGVYACMADVDGKTWEAVTNIGVRPTFDHRTASTQIETHLLDFSKDLYQQRVELSFVARLRDERRFSGVQALVSQIQLDIQLAREILVDNGIE